MIEFIKRILGYQRYVSRPKSYKTAKAIYEHKMTPEEKEKQRRSFTYGNTKIENDQITREIIDRAAENLE